jgi:hypothetical protein
MDARWKVALWFCCGLLTAGVARPGAVEANNARGRTRNFIVLSAPSQEMAQRVGKAAERYRRELALHWLGRELPPWQTPCTIRVIAGNMPAQGETQYNRYPGRVGDFHMEVVGTPQRILDSVLPHEVTHTVMASHFGKPLPRWADEGIATTVEHEAEKSKHEGKLREFLTTGRGIPMNQMFMMTEYPPEMLTLYAQGYSVCNFLIAQKGPEQFVQFLESYFQQRSWTRAVREHYQYASLGELQDYWLAWVRQGGGSVDSFTKSGQLAAASPAEASPAAKQSAGDPPSARPWGPAATAVAASGNPTGGEASTMASGAASTYSASQPQPPQPVGSVVPVGAASSWSPATQTRRR